VHGPIHDKNVPMNGHVHIIGAGIVGMSSAAFLQRGGYQVTVIDRVPPGEGCSFGNAGGVAFGEIMPTIHPKIFRKLPGWLMDPLGPLTIRWSYLPNALPWFLAAARNTTASRMSAITAARAALGLRVVSDFETLLNNAGRSDLMAKREALRVFDSAKQFESEAEERQIKTQLGFPCETFSGDQNKSPMVPLMVAGISSKTRKAWLNPLPQNLLPTVARFCWTR
jgi:D-amino-acid dehydrogenase